MTQAFSTRRLLATAALAALALPALAQTPPPPAAPAARTANANADAPGRGARDGRDGDMQKRHQEHMAKRQAALKEKLKLTPAQEGAWTEFTTAMKPPARPARPDPKELDKLTTPERIDRMRALRAQHAAEADRRDDAVKKFYASLNPTQQKTFDAEAPRGPGMHGRPGMHGGPGGHDHGKRGGPQGRPTPDGEGSPR